jgi:hypothetical protein
MDILTAVRHAAARLHDATAPPDTAPAQPTGAAGPTSTAPPVTALACIAAETGEAAALALVHLGATDDAPAYLTAANGFALARDELEHAAGAAAVDNDTVTWHAGSTDVLAVEAALADLAAALVTALASASMRLARPEPIVALGRAGLAAADAYRAMHRDPSHAHHVR